MLPHGGNKERRERTCNLEDSGRIAWSHLIPRLSSPLHPCACGANGSIPDEQKAASASPQSEKILTVVILLQVPTTCLGLTAVGQDAFRRSRSTSGTQPALPSDAETDAGRAEQLAAWGYASFSAQMRRSDAPHGGQLMRRLQSHAVPLVENARPLSRSAKTQLLRPWSAQVNGELYDIQAVEDTAWPESLGPLVACPCSMEVGEAATGVRVMWKPFLHRLCPSRSVKLQPASPVTPSSLSSAHLSKWVKLQRPLRPGLAPQSPVPNQVGEVAAGIPGQSTRKRRALVGE